MTLLQARKRFPLIRPEVLQWAVENIDDPRALERCLVHLEQTKRIQLRYGDS